MNKCLVLQVMRLCESGHFVVFAEVVPLLLLRIPSFVHTLYVLCLDLVGRHL